MTITDYVTNYVEAQQSEDKNYVFDSEFNMPRYRNTNHFILCPKEYERAVDNYDYSRSEDVKNVVIDNLTHITAGLSMDFRKAKGLCKDIALIVANTIELTRGKDIEGLTYFVKSENMPELSALETLYDFIVEENDGFADLESATFEACCNMVGVTSRVVFDDFVSWCCEVIEDEICRLLDVRSTYAKHNFCTLEADVVWLRHSEDRQGLEVFIYDPKG